MVNKEGTGKLDMDLQSLTPHDVFQMVQQ